MVPRPVVQHAGAARAFGVEPFLFAVAILSDDGRRGVENYLRRPIVAFERDCPSLRKIVFEIQDVAEVCATPLVDGLIGIAHDAQVPMARCELLNEQVLRAICVLVLVDHEKAKLLAVPVANELGPLEQLNCLEQQVVEVERAGVGQSFEIELVQGADLSIAGIPGVVGKDLWALHPVLRMTDARQRLTRLHARVANANLPHRLLNHGQLIGGVVDDEVSG